MSPEEIIEWFDNVWEKLDCTYYEEYNMKGRVA
jgi:hypothetical protein